MVQTFQSAVFFLASLFVMFAVLVAMTGRAPSELPEDYAPFVAGVGLLGTFVLNARSAGVAVLIGLSGVAILVLRDSSGSIDAWDMTAFYLAILIGSIAHRFNTIALVLIVVLGLTLVLAGRFWSAGACIILGVAALYVDHAIGSAFRFLKKSGFSFGKHSIGMAWFVVAYSISIFAFAIICRCLDVISSSPNFRFDWLSDESPSFWSYLCMSAMAISGSAVDVHPKTTAGAAILSIQAIAGLFLLVIVLQKFLETSEYLSTESNWK